jgi:hypothetical protein
MSEEQQLKIKEWVRRWQLAGPVLEGISDEELRAVETIRAIQAFEGLVFAALREQPARAESGLVEQQRLFRKVRL